MEATMKRDGFLSIFKKTSYFSFSGRSDNISDYSAYNKDSTIRSFKYEGRRAKVIETSIAALSISLDKIGSIRIDVEDHITSIVANLWIWIDSYVIEEHHAAFFCLLSSSSLIATEFVESNTSSGIKSSELVQKGSDDRLNE